MRRDTMDGETSVSHDHGHGPHLRCGLSSPPATPLAPLTLWCRPVGGEGGGKHATMIGERSGTAARETGDSPWLWCPSSDHHTLEILAAGKGKGPPSSPSHPPDSSLASGSFWEGPYSLCQCFEAPGMSREPRRLGLPTGVGGREGGANRHRWGARAGVRWVPRQLAGLGSGRGPETEPLNWSGPSWERGANPEGATLKCSLGSGSIYPLQPSRPT